MHLKIFQRLSRYSLGTREILPDSFIQDLADKHIPSKTSRSVTLVPWIIPEIRRRIHRRNKTHTTAKKDGQLEAQIKF